MRSAARRSRLCGAVAGQVGWHALKPFSCCAAAPAACNKMLNALLMAPAADLPAAQPACSAAEQVAILTSLAFKLHAIVDDGFGSACTGDSMHTCNVSGLGRRKECMRRVCSATALTLAKTGDRR
eukprot:4939493-Prymnesium_polylepis.1